LALALERLEARQLLAITVTEQNLADYKAGADYVFADPTSITGFPHISSVISSLFKPQ